MLEPQLLNHHKYRLYQITPETVRPMIKFIVTFFNHSEKLKVQTW
jgi:hypothetical protein